MGLTQIPQINIYIRDKSDLPNISAGGTICASVLNGERGFEELISVDRKTFYKYFTDIEKSIDKKAYAGCVELLKNASELNLACVSKNAKYGGVYITDKGLLPFHFGVSSLNSFNMYNVVRVERSNFIGNTSSGLVDLTKGVVKVGTLKIEYRLAGVDKIAIVDNDWNVTNDSNITSFSFDNNTGKYSITFNTRPDGDKFYFVYSSYSNEYSGLVNKDTGNGNKTEFSFTIDYDNVILDSVYVYYVTNGNNYIAKSNASGVITGTNVNTGSVVFNNTTKKYDVNIKFDNPLDNGSILSVSYVKVIKYLGCIIAKGNKKWSNKYGYKIRSVDSNNKTFVVDEYEKQDDGSNFFITSYEISRKVDGVDRYGKNIYLNSVLDNSYYGIGINNDEYNYDILPSITNSVVYMNGGDDGDVVDDVTIASYLDKFLDEKVYFNFFCGNGITSKTLIDKISVIVNAKNKQAYMDVIDDNVNNVKLWAEQNIPDDMRMFWFSPWVYTSVNGVVYYTPVSALVLSKQCELVNNGKRFMSPSGVGNGSINVVKLARYYGESDQKKLSPVNVNVIRYFKEFGAVVFDNQTGQKKFSGTSFINSVLTLNDMLENFNNILPVLQLNRVIDDNVFILLRQMIESYLRLLEVNEGTIEPSGSKYGWVLKIDELNNAITRDMKEVNCELIFSFQSVLRTVNLYLTYMSNQMIVKFK